MADDFEIATCYIDLDTLFDTRMATIHQFGLEAVEKTYKGGYCDRISDEFDGVDTDKFNEAYRNRNIETLKQAMITPVVEVILQFAKQTLVALVSSPFRRQPKVIINIYPYKLSDEAVVSIITGMRIATERLMDIEVINMSPEELTPEYVKANFILMAMYDSIGWLDIHSKNQNLVKTQCPQVTLIAPELFRSKEALRTISVEMATTAIEKHASLFIKLILYPMRTFCIDMNRMKASIKKT